MCCKIQPFYQRQHYDYQICTVDDPAIHILFYNFVNNGTFCVISDAVIMALLAETKVQGIQIRE